MGAQKNGFATNAADTRSGLLTFDPEAGILIGADWHRGDREFMVRDPADAALVSTVADATVAQAREAVDAAVAAGEVWAAKNPRERSDLLRTVFELMLRDRDDLADLIVAENGKARADALAEVSYAAEFFRWYAEEAVRLDGTYAAAPAGGARTIVHHRPVGVAALVTPWNFPAGMVARKVAPALAAGCTVVLKPAEETPLTALAIAALALEAGIPGGVINIVPTTRTPEVVSSWLADPRVRKISFTGSTQVGRLLMRQAADRVVNSAMELGGNAPFVVCADADVSAAVEGAMIAKFRGGGQACTAANRFYVHARVLEEFLALMGERVQRLVVGPGSAAATQVGPLISREAVARTNGLVDLALASGAKVVARAEMPSNPAGSFLAPVLLRDVPYDAQIVREEIFAPVASVVTWTDDTDLLGLLNDSELALASYIYSRDLKAALKLAEQIDAGMVGINRGIVSDPAAPFGGMKQSGIGREGAQEGVLQYTETQYISIDW